MDAVLLRGWGLIVAGSMLFFCVHALAWPLGPGRDALGYFAYYYDFGQPHPYDFLFLLFRTPLPSFFFTPLLERFGSIFVELLLCFAYVGIHLLWFRALLPLGFRIALVSVAALWLQAGYASLFHVISSDGPTAFFVLLFIATLLEFVRRGRPVWMLATGIGGGLLFFCRPANQLFLAFVFVPLVLPAIPWRSKFLGMLFFLVGMLPFLGGWAWHNYQDSGVVTLARGTYLINPIWRLWVRDGLVHPENGPASKRLAELVQREIIGPQKFAGQPARNAAEYFAQNDYNMKLTELKEMLDRLNGHETNYVLLRDVAVEAIKAHPGRYAWNVTKTFLHSLALNLKWPVPLRGGALVFTHKGFVKFMGDDAADDQLPLGKADLSTIQDSPRYLELLRSQHPSIARAYELQHRELPRRNGSVILGTILNWMAQLYPPMPLWIFFGICGLFLRKANKEVWVLGLATAFGLGHILAGCLAIHVPVYQYRLYFDPIFIAFGVWGLAAIAARRFPNFFAA